MNVGAAVEALPQRAKRILATQFGPYEHRVMRCVAIPWAAAMQTGARDGERTSMASLTSVGQHRPGARHALGVGAHVLGKSYTPAPAPGPTNPSETAPETTVELQIPSDAQFLARRQVVLAVADTSSGPRVVAEVLPTYVGTDFLLHGEVWTSVTEDERERFVPLKTGNVVVLDPGQARRAYAYKLEVVRAAPDPRTVAALKSLAPRASPGPDATENDAAADYSSEEYSSTDSEFEREFGPFP